jgi:pSer/pThr/pTyr-binding forkhead associated (FHA) protein
MAILKQLLDDVVANSFEVLDERLTIGRHPENDICIDDVAVSARHAALEAVTNRDFPQFREYFLVDLNSTNGTYVNELPVSGRQRLHHNDQVRIAWNCFKFVDPDQLSLEQTAHILPGDEQEFSRR